MTHTAEPCTHHYKKRGGPMWGGPYVVSCEHCYEEPDIDEIIEALNTLAGLRPETVREMREVLIECADALKDLLEDLGGCDHSVGICNCDLERIMHCARDALKAVEED